MSYNSVKIWRRKNKNGQENIFFNINLINNDLIKDIVPKEGDDEYHFLLFDSQKYKVDFLFIKLSSDKLMKSKAIAQIQFTAVTVSTYWAVTWDIKLSTCFFSLFFFKVEMYLFNELFYIIRITKFVLNSSIKTCLQCLNYMPQIVKRKQQTLCFFWFVFVWHNIKKTSLLRRLQPQTLLDEDPPIG